MFSLNVSVTYLWLYRVLSIANIAVKSRSRSRQPCQHNVPTNQISFIPREASSSFPIQYAVPFNSFFQYLIIRVKRKRSQFHRLTPLDYVLLWLSGLRCRSVDIEIQVRSRIRTYVVFLFIIRSVQHVDKAVVNCLFKS